MNLLFTTYEPATATLLFQSTLVMNIITWDAVLCTYPLMVRERVGLVNSDRMDERTLGGAHVRKYRDRGFEFLRTAHYWRATHVCGESGYCGATGRRLTDSTTMRIHLSGAIGQKINSIDDSVSWKLACCSACGYNVESETSSVGWVRSQLCGELGECESLLWLQFDPN